MNESHQCQALVITCIDYRFVSPQRDFLLPSYEGKYDLIPTPGSSKEISKIEDSIATSVKLHDPKEILVFDHENCGAYGVEDSLDAHQTNLLKAKSTLEKTYPNRTVKLFLTGFETVKEIN